MICNCGSEVKKTYDLYAGEDEITILGWKEDEIIAEVYICKSCGAGWQLMNKDKYNLTPQDTIN